MKDNLPTTYSYLKMGKKTYLFITILSIGMAIFFWEQKEYAYFAFVPGCFLGLMYRDFQWVIAFREF